MPIINAQDGKTYEFSDRQKVSKESCLTSDGFVVKFVFRNGVVRELPITTEHPLYNQFALHGANQKFGDELAGVDDVEDCVEFFDDLAARISNGEWTERRERGVSGTSYLARALAEISGKSLEEVQAKLKETPREQKAALLKSNRVQAVILRLKAEKLKTPDADAEEAVESFLA